MATTLPDRALLRVLAADPALAPESAAALAAAIERLFVQFIREGRCAAAEVGVERDGRFLVIAWDGPALSGCSHDKIAQVVAAHEARCGARLLDAPPIAVGDPPLLVDRAGLKALVAGGGLDADAPWWDLRAATLGAWRAGPVPLAHSPFARVLGAAS